MSITKRVYGKTENGHSVDIYTLKNSKGMVAEITNFGGIIVSLSVPDKNGKLNDVVLGYDKLDKYTKEGPYFGALIGRYANRIGKASFELDGVEYKLAKNDGENHLHGGLKGFDKVVWTAEVLKAGENEALELTYFSEDGEENYPGNIKIKVTYTLTEDNAISIDYFAVSDKNTVVNLTNHSYFNLSGHAAGDILDHKVLINADSFTVTDKYSIPTGELRPVKGTPMDFTNLKAVREDISSDYEQIVFGKGYDHNWVLNTSKNELSKAAEVVDEKSGRVMEVYTTMPGVQFYTGNFLNGVDGGKEGAVYNQRAGLCLETQYFPNAMKHENFPSPILKAQEEYKHTTIYKFFNK